MDGVDGVDGEHVHGGLKWRCRCILSALGGPIQTGAPPALTRSCLTLPPPLPRRFFDKFEAVYSQFNQAQLSSSLDNDQFLALLKQLDDCKSYVATNPQVRNFKDMYRG